MRPNRLKKGDLVQIIAPASHFEKEQLEKGAALLENSFGLRVKWRDDIFSRDGYLAGSDQRRKAEFQEAFEDTEVSGIFCARGGYGSSRIIQDLDNEIVRSNPKVFVGFSDITMILLWLNVISDLVVFHGPMVAGRMAKTLSAEETELIRKVLFSADPAGSIGKTAGTKTLKSGTARGRLIGGSLSMLVSTIGTPSQPDTNGAILVLEDVGEKPYRIDRMLHHLKQSGLLDPVAALVWGEFNRCDANDKNQRSTLQVIEEFTAASGVPSIYGLPFGHGEENRILPLGAAATLDAERCELSIVESAVQ